MRVGRGGAAVVLGREPPGRRALPVVQGCAHFRVVRFSLLTCLCLCLRYVMSTTVYEYEYVINLICFIVDWCHVKDEAMY